MAIVQAGNTVLFLYPTPNSLNSPSWPYAKLGFIQWNIENNIKNNTIAKLALWILTKAGENIGSVILILSKKWVDIYFKGTVGSLKIPPFVEPSVLHLAERIQEYYVCKWNYINFYRIANDTCVIILRSGTIDVYL